MPIAGSGKDPEGKQAMMMVRIRRFTTMMAVTLAPLAFVTLVSPGVSRAAECGQGTVYDAPSNTCVAAQQPPPTPVAAEQPPPTPPPPPPPPPPPWNGPTPWVSASICAPIPFVSLCTGI